MLSRKRPIRAVNGDVGVPSRDNDSTLLSRIRNMWQFANFCQWIYIFGKTAKIDDAIDIEVNIHPIFFCSLISSSLRLLILAARSSKPNA